MTAGLNPVFLIKSGIRIRLRDVTPCPNEIAQAEARKPPEPGHSAGEMLKLRLTGEERPDVDLPARNRNDWNDSGSGSSHLVIQRG